VFVKVVRVDNVGWMDCCVRLCSLDVENRMGVVFVQIICSSDTCCDEEGK
jgi:hypothetical protein